MSSTNSTDTTAAIEQLLQQIGVLMATLNDVVSNFPSIMFAGAGCLAAVTRFSFGHWFNSTDRVSATFCLVDTALIAASFGSSYLLVGRVACFVCAGMTTAIVNVCAVERFLVILTNRAVKWSILGFAILANAVNVVHSQPRSRPLSNPSSPSLSQSKLKSIYLVLVVHHIHILTTVAVYLIFGVSIILTLHQSGLRGPLAFFMYTTIIAIETGLEDVSRAISRTNKGKEPTKNEPQHAVVNADHSQTTAVASQQRTPLLMSPPTPTPGSATIQHARSPASMMYHYDPIFAQQPRPDGMENDANSRVFYAVKNAEK
ncbi:hypothetical protein BJ742DRAFT_770568 [Cladochytrium replicatum]|nr:hypothetical protein BJ742DRAFT_770568 [Cladochytrium replicatum]